jgi:hypothetical protein
MCNDVLFLLAELGFLCITVWIHISSLVSLSEPFLHSNAKLHVRMLSSFPLLTIISFSFTTSAYVGYMVFSILHPPSSMTPCVPLFPASCIYSTPFSALILHLFSFSQFPLQFSKSTSLFLITFSSKGLC